MGVVWSPPGSWEGWQRLPETTPSWWQGALHPRLRELCEADPGSRFRPALRSPPHPFPPRSRFPAPQSPPFLPLPLPPSSESRVPRSPSPLPSSLHGPGPPPPPPPRLPACSGFRAPGVSGSLPRLRRPRALPTTPPCPPRGAPPPLPTSPNSTFPRAAGRPAPCVRAPQRTVRGPAAAGGEAGSRGPDPGAEARFQAPPGTQARHPEGLPCCTADWPRHASAPGFPARTSGSPETQSLGPIRHLWAEKSPLHPGDPGQENRDT